jgi:hypothetical protein
MNKSSLYFSLNSNLSSTDLKKTEKDEIIESINIIDTESKKAILNLIIQHYINTIENAMEELKNGVIPYDGITNKNGSLQFKLGNFPIPLRRIIYKFIKILKK